MRSLFFSMFLRVLRLNKSSGSCAIAAPNTSRQRHARRASRSLPIPWAPRRPDTLSIPGCGCSGGILLSALPVLTPSQVGKARQVLGQHQGQASIGDSSAGYASLNECVTKIVPRRPQTMRTPFGTSFSTVVCCRASTDHMAATPREIKRTGFS